MSQRDKDSVNVRISATAEIVSAYLLNHKTDLDVLETIIERIYSKLKSLDVTGDEVGANLSQTAAIDIAASVTPDYIICLEDGKKLKMLKRYLKTNFNMSPEEYRKRWSLPATYPMVAPNYAKKRSKLAKEIGLGKRGAAARSATPNTAKPEPESLPRSIAKPKGELPKGKGKLQIVKTTDVMKARV
ncbi:MAG: MucR family transcriptional regulator [Rickettsiales bacterium]|nr:MucR family transcriptional regulator [Rickettsiales bacterium]